MSHFVDFHTKHLVPLIPSYLQDTPDLLRHLETLNQTPLPLFSLLEQELIVLEVQKYLSIMNICGLKKTEKWREVEPFFLTEVEKNLHEQWGKFNQIN